MKRRLIFPLMLIAVLLTACAAPQTNPPAVSSAPSESQPLAQATQQPAVAAVATSRGDNLEASDPASVQIASGGVQLIEFFRFT